MKNKTFDYTIRSKEIASELLDMGFTVIKSSPDIGWNLQSPPDLSKSKARKLVSQTIKLYLAAKDLDRAQTRYENCVEKINKINLKR